MSWSLGIGVVEPRLIGVARQEVIDEIISLLGKGCTSPGITFKGVRLGTIVDLPDDHLIGVEPGLYAIGFEGCNELIRLGAYALDEPTKDRSTTAGLNSVELDVTVAAGGTGRQYLLAAALALAFSSSGSSVVEDQGLRWSGTLATPTELLRQSLRLPAAIEPFDQRVRRFFERLPVDVHKEEKR